MREAQNIEAVAELGIDMMGFIFYEKSPRCVREPVARSPKEEGIERVGVFVNADIQDILDKAAAFDLDCIQLHGSESADYCRQLREVWKGKIFKAISVKEAEDVEKAKEYISSIIDLFLFDTKCKTMGGSGEQFDWSVLDHYDGDIPFLLSGGIGPDDVERVKAFWHPKCIGVDLNSRFETAPALKDAHLLKRFIQEIKEK